jgi:hypothetical protein
LFSKPGELERIEGDLQEMIAKKSAIVKYRQDLKEEKDSKEYKPTRRDKRAEREMQKLKDKINVAG